MFKDFILKDTELAIKQAVEAKELGQMDSTDGINLVVEKPKNPDFGDFAVNVSSLARNARIAPPMIANAIVKYLPTTDYTTSVIGGFINFKLSDNISKKKKLFLNTYQQTQPVHSILVTADGQQWVVH